MGPALQQSRGLAKLGTPPRRQADPGPDTLSGRRADRRRGMAAGPRPPVLRECTARPGPLPQIRHFHPVPAHKPRNSHPGIDTVMLERRLLVQLLSSRESPHRSQLTCRCVASYSGTHGEVLPDRKLTSLPMITVQGRLWMNEPDGTVPAPGALMTAVTPVRAPRVTKDSCPMNASVLLRHPHVVRACPVSKPRASCQVRP